MQTICPVCLTPLTLRTKKGKISRNKCNNCKINLLAPAGKDCLLIAADFAPVEKIGEGATSIVYKAWQLSLNRYVALKIFKGSSSNLKAISQFLYEARAIGKLSHKNIVKCYSCGEKDNIYFMSMEFVKGCSLKNFIKNNGGKLDQYKVLEIIRQLTDALCHIWQKERLIHRDIKPENIMIAEDGTVKLIDLGTVLSQSDWEANMEIIGTPNYMSPDQFKGKLLDFNSDIYNIGIMLYEMITGRLPYDANNISSIAKKHMAKEFIPLDTAGMSKDICILINRMLQIAPNRKFDSPEEFQYEIDKIIKSFNK